jgi:guanine deaminase
MSIVRALRGPLLNPRRDGTVEFIEDALLLGDEKGRIVAIGPWQRLSSRLGSAASSVPISRGLIMPPMLDAHIHIPQHPVRGKFVEGIDNPLEGRLIAGLNRNVFPAERRCEEADAARAVIDAFAADTLAHGVIGGAAYMTVHASATGAALEQLPDTWSVGLVLMNQHCPEYLRTDQPSLEADVEVLAREYGARLIVTDRFAVSVDASLRKRGVELARRFGLRMQTHLNEQLAEKRFVEKELYADAASYTDVYRRDGLLACDPLMAHCVRMRDEEFDMLAASPATIVHCPVSNTLLGSGVMPLDKVVERAIPYAICTDVGASPTTSLLCEMAQFLKVHAGRSAAATPEAALYGITLAPAIALGLERRIGTFEPGMEMSFVEIACEPEALKHSSVSDVILHALLGMSRKELACYEPGGSIGVAIDRLQRDGLESGDNMNLLTEDVRTTAQELDEKVQSVTVAGRVIWQR